MFYINGLWGYFLFNYLGYILFGGYYNSIGLQQAELQKPIIATIGVLLTVGTFRLIIYPDGFIYDDMFYLFPCYCICIGGASLFFDLREKTASRPTIKEG